jgi:ribosomal protein S18 acetylase RimI-like enzyme
MPSLINALQKEGPRPAAGSGENRIDSGATAAPDSPTGEPADKSVISLRPGTPAEVAAIDGHLFEHPYDESVFRQWLDIHPDCLNIAEIDGKAAGYIMDVKAEEDKTVWILSAAVLKEHQGKGVGRQLVEWVQNNRATQSIEKVKLTVDPANPAKGLYTRCGFEVTEENVKDYFGRGEHRDVMTWELTAEAIPGLVIDTAMVEQNTSAIREALDGREKAPILIAGSEYIWDV